MPTDALFMTVQISVPQDPTSNIQMLLRWLHFLAGITWIGLLYFFNLVNVDFMKALDAPTKSKVVPQLMPRALWWFRWGAVVTVLSGLLYYLMILGSEPRFGQTFLAWVLVTGVAYALMYGVLQVSQGPLNNGRIVAVVLTVLALVVAWLILTLNGHPTASTRSLSIGIGGGYGIMMLLNVWLIIWPCQKKIIAWTVESAEKGTKAPAEMATLARRAFLASRTNTFLSLPMLFFMAAASHYPMFSPRQ
ncbi:MAG: urate hydroxylase PuuD [Candidatus Omnitrophica bacterium]|nr:urate hydroxylase PuuD [Candidatus Omnitrophota bacterium]